VSFLCFAPTNKNNNKSNKKSSQNNTQKGKGRKVPRSSTKSRKAPDEGIRALVSSIISNSNPKSRAVAFAKPPSIGTQVKLSKCCAKYAFAISDPFSPLSTGVCVPSGQATATHKVTGFVRFDSKIGTAGFAYIAISPSGARDAPQLFVTGAAYNGTTVAITSTVAGFFATGLNPISVSNLPYSVDNLTVRSAEDSQEVACRVVSAGVAVQYTGTALNQSGMAYMYRDPAHKNVSLTPGTLTNNTIQSLSGNPLTTICNFTRDRCSVSDFASNPDEMNFLSRSESLGTNTLNHRTLLTYPFCGGEGDLSNTNNLVSTLTQTTSSGTTYLVGAPTTIICVTGQAGQDFHVEYVVHVEYVGNIAAASYTATDSDVQGSGMVLEAANMIQQRKTAKPDASSWSLMYEGLSYAAKKSAPILIPLAEKALMSLLA